MAYREQVLASNPAGYYRMDEASGATFADASGNGNTLTLSNVTQVSYSQTSVLTGDNNTAIKGSSSATFVGTVANPPTTIGSGMSAELWTKRTVLNTTDITAPIIIKFMTTLPNNEWRVFMRAAVNSDLMVGYMANGQSAVYVGNYSTNQQLHVVALYDGTYFDIYVNNSRIVHVARTGNNFGTVSLFNIVGASGDYCRDMLIDEVAYYNRVLTPTEIALHYGYGNGSLIDPRGDSRPILRPSFNPTAQSIHRLGL